MKLTRCNNGHIYNGSVHSTCPYCSEGTAINMGQQQSASGVQGGSKVNMMNVSSLNSVNAARAESTPEMRPMDYVQADDDKTVAYWIGNMDMDPTVGWLVCIHGRDRGKDYRIRSEKNFIGRSEDMDICIQGDKSISRRNHCVISYNPKQRNFMIIPGDGTGIVYVQNEAVYSPRNLESFDSIEIGESKFVFVPLCGENFDWKME